MNWWAVSGALVMNLGTLLAVSSMLPPRIAQDYTARWIAAACWLVGSMLLGVR